MQLQLGHRCIASGCSDLACPLCCNNRSRRCGSDFKAKYVSDDYLRACCGAGLAVALIDGNGQPVTEPELPLQIHMLDNKKYKEINPRNQQLELQQLQPAVSDRPLLKWLGLGETSMLQLQLQGGQASLSELRCFKPEGNQAGGSSQAGQTTTFRLLLFVPGREATIAPFVSKEFVIVGKRAGRDAKCDIPGHDESPVRLEGVGKDAAAALRNLGQKLGPEAGLPEDLYCVDTVAKFCTLLSWGMESNMNEKHLASLFKAADLKKSKEHARRMALPDYRPRVYWPPATLNPADPTPQQQQQGLLFLCKDGAVQFSRPAAWVYRQQGLSPGVAGGLGFMMDDVIGELGPAEKQQLGAVVQQALQDWLTPHHSNWGIYWDDELGDPIGQAAEDGLPDRWLLLPAAVGAVPAAAAGGGRGLLDISYNQQQQQQQGFFAGSGVQQGLQPLLLPDGQQQYAVSSGAELGSPELLPPGAELTPFAVAAGMRQQQQQQQLVTPPLSPRLQPPVSPLSGAKRVREASLQLPPEVPTDWQQQQQQVQYAIPAAAIQQLLPQADDVQQQQQQLTQTLLTPPGTPPPAAAATSGWPQQQLQLQQEAYPAAVACAGVGWLQPPPSAAAAAAASNTQQQQQQGGFTVQNPPEHLLNALKGTSLMPAGDDQLLQLQQQQYDELLQLHTSDLPSLPYEVQQAGTTTAAAAAVETAAQDASFVSLMQDAIQQQPVQLQLQPSLGEPAAPTAATDSLNLSALDELLEELQDEYGEVQGKEAAAAAAVAPVAAAVAAAPVAAAVAAAAAPAAAAAVAQQQAGPVGGDMDPPSHWSLLLQQSIEYGAVDEEADLAAAAAAGLDNAAPQQQQQVQGVVAMESITYMDSHFQLVIQPSVAMGSPAAAVAAGGGSVQQQQQQPLGQRSFDPDTLFQNSSEMSDQASERQQQQEVSSAVGGFSRHNPPERLLAAFQTLQSLMPAAAAETAPGTAAHDHHHQQQQQQGALDGLISGVQDMSISLQDELAGLLDSKGF